MHRLDMAYYQQPGYPPAKPDFGAQPPPLSPVEPPPPQRGADKEDAKSILSTIIILVAAPLIALFLTAFVFQSYEVDGPSMQSTLQDNDRLVVLKAEQSWAKLTNQPNIPARGEIIVFVHSAEGSEKQLIKRVIGLPGDHVVVHGGTLTIYNAEHPEGFMPDETLPYGDTIGTTPGNVDIVVPPGEVFAVGDNRSNSLDSRTFGTVPSEDIVGTLALRILPLSKAQTF